MSSLPDHLVGPLAGLGASTGWLFTSIFFTAAGKRVGPTVVNTVRLFVAVAILAVMNRALSGAWLPGEATQAQVLFLALSGLVGLAIGDQCLFTAFVDIGPRLALLIMTTAPIFAAVFGLVSLGETLGGLELVGIAITLAGVAWVVAERPHTEADDRPHPHRRRGIVLALLGSACQAGGALLSKLGMGHGLVPPEMHMAPLTATLVRMVFAAIFVLPIYVVYRRRALRARAQGVLPRRTGTRTGGAVFILLGALAGPFFGVWMSLIAYDHDDIGVAQTMCSLSPVLILPFAYFLYRERINARAVVGAFIALAGVAMLTIFSGPSPVADPGVPATPSAGEAAPASASEPSQPSASSADG